MEKQSNISRLMGYAGKHKYFTYASWFLSAISALIALLPFIYIWKIIKEVLFVAPDFSSATGLVHNGIMAMVFAIAAFLVYIGALMCSHLAAFRVATNMRIAVTEHIAKLPLGFADSFGSGKLRKIINDATGATDEEVMSAARLANVDEFAEKLPEKWNTNIGENGCELSGGERQRISIARAFLKDAPIILLDEATASLDVENETMIQTALSRLIKDKTVLIIAHRMRTVAGADKIVVLAGGVVAEQGTPGELYKKNGIYTRMVDLQSASGKWKIK